MKATRNHRKVTHPNLRVYRRPYPNAADPSYYIDRLIDGMLAVVTGMGSVSIFFFLVTM